MKRILKQFIITINGFNDIDIDARGVSDDFKNHISTLQSGSNGLIVDEQVFDDLCRNTIDYCYEAIRGSGDRIHPDSRDRLSTLIGEYLFKILLQNPTGDKMIASIHANEQIEEEELHLILRFGESEQAQILASLPWEYMYCPKYKDPKGIGFSLLTKVRFARQYTFVSKGLGPVDRLKVLIFFAPGEPCSDAQINELQAINDRLNEAFRPAIEFIFIPPRVDARAQASHLNFFKTVGRQTPDIIHFIGEARSAEGAEELSFWDHSGSGQPEPHWIKISTSFQDRLQRALQQSETKMVFFHAWKNKDNQAYYGFQQVALHLLEKRVPAVLTVPYTFNPYDRPDLPLFDEFFSKFYGILHSKQESLTEAIFCIRNLLYTEGKGFPILYAGNADLGDLRLKVQTGESPAGQRRASGEQSEGRFGRDPSTGPRKPNAAQGYGTDNSDLTARELQVKKKIFKDTLDSLIDKLKVELTDKAEQNRNVKRIRQHWESLQNQLVEVQETRNPNAPKAVGELKRTTKKNLEFTHGDILKLIEYIDAKELDEPSKNKLRSFLHEKNNIIQDFVKHWENHNPIKPHG